MGLYSRKMPWAHFSGSDDYTYTAPKKSKNTNEKSALIQLASQYQGQRALLKNKLKLVFEDK